MISDPDSIVTCYALALGVGCGRLLYGPLVAHL
jgi:hypothetical protein